ncbi:O-antigen ligase family protein [Stenotrophomonas mori]|uniref:O-antigen ligase family protein n=1 Tax=Stenotrophomonas mori TaxID=2871096 RepID=A0ABT0SJZ0_9GAMM|nr:O-antigen ligase family protein [Stenotrophomonas mori]MCL7715652.1 O-antigen ligase family protein [Stenotrophomonas mori]
MPNLPADAPLPRAPERAGGWTPAAVLAFVALWPAPGLAETVLLAGAGLMALQRMQGRLRGAPVMAPGAPALALVGGLFLAYWLPQLLSAPAAVDPARAWRKALAGVRYLPFMWMAAAAVATDARRQATFTGLAVITGLWTLDGVLQALAGGSPLFWTMDRLKVLIDGHAVCSAAEAAAADRLSGAFGPCNLKFGQVLASLSPFLLFAVARRWGRTGWLLAALAVGGVLVLAGSRASWITYALVLLFSGWRLLGSRWMVVLLLCGALGVAALAGVSSQVRERVARTALAVNGDAGGVDAALSGRGRIWTAAVCMVRAHPVTGVGARGFREAYPACSPAEDGPGAWGAGPALHAHQIVLEILAETGLLGLLLWLAGGLAAWRAWHRADAAARARARPATLALAVTVFPLNTHLAFYSTFWGGLTLLLAALFAGALRARDPAQPPRA